MNKRRVKGSWQDKLTRRQSWKLRVTKVILWTAVQRMRTSLDLYCRLPAVSRYKGLPTLYKQPNKINKNIQVSHLISELRKLASKLFKHLTWRHQDAHTQYMRIVPIVSRLLILCLVVEIIKKACDVAKVLNLYRYY